MSTPRTDAYILPQYQLLCVYLVKARDGDPKSKALLEISLGEFEERRRADRFLPYFETFRRLLERPASPPAAGTTAATAAVAAPDARSGALGPPGEAEGPGQVVLGLGDRRAPRLAGSSGSDTTAGRSPAGPASPGIAPSRGSSGRGSRGSGSRRPPTPPGSTSRAGPTGA